MKRPNSLRMILASALGVLVLLIAVTLLLRGDREEEPAPAAVLNEIAEKNRDASAEAAAAFKAEAAAASRAADLKAQAFEANGMGGPVEN